VSSSISSSDTAIEADKPKSQPRRFLINMLATATVGLGLFWTITANFRQGFLEADYAIQAAKYRLIDDCRLAGTVVIGDSRASADFVPAELPDTVNLGVGGGSPIDFYYVARRVLACPTPPKRVILSITIPNLVRADMFWQRTALFGFLSFADLEEIRRVARSLDDHTIYPSPTIGDYEARVEDWLYAHYFPSFYTASLLNSGIVGRLHKNLQAGAATLQSGGQHLYGTSERSDLVASDADIRQFRVPPILDYYLRRMLDMFSAHGTNVEFIGAPMNDVTYAALDPAVVTAYRQYLEALSHQVPNFRIDGDPVVHWDDGWFGDQSHLNEAGARRFSAQVLKTFGGRDQARQSP
jgi:hypothetical protein